MTHTYRTIGTCSTEIDFDLEGDRVYNVQYTSGCNGNLQAVSRLVDGMTVDEIEEKLKGIHCGFKQTSCGDQLAIAVRQAYEQEQQNKKRTPDPCRLDR